MPSTWVIVADSSRARIFTVDSPTDPLRELEDWAHPQSRLQDRELTSTPPGRAFDSAGQGRHAIEPKESPQRHEAVTFAKELGERLETARISGEFDRLVIVAAPAFLGMLRDKLSVPTLKLVTEQIAKNLATFEPAVIRGHLPERL